MSYGSSGFKAAYKQGGIQPDNGDIGLVDRGHVAELAGGRMPGIMNGDVVGTAELDCACEAQQPKGEFRALFRAAA